MDCCKCPVAMITNKHTNILFAYHNAQNGKIIIKLYNIIFMILHDIIIWASCRPADGCPQIVKKYPTYLIVQIVKKYPTNLRVTVQGKIMLNHIL